MLTSQKTAQLQSLGEMIAREVVFAEAGKDLGLLPINSLLAQMEDILRGAGVPEALAQGMQQARGWLDKIFDSDGVFSQEDITRLGAWVSWWEEALDALAQSVSENYANQNSAGVSPAGSGGVPPPILNSQTRSQERQPSLLPGDAGAAHTLASAPSISIPLPEPPSQEGIHYSKFTIQNSAVEEPALFLNQSQDRELLGEFVAESLEHLHNLEQGLLVLEDNPLDEETLHSIFRAFHTFKGSAGFLNLGAIHSVAHELESLLDLARQKKMAVTPEIIELILGGADTLKQFIGSIREQLAGLPPPGPILVPTRDLLARIHATLAAPSSSNLVGRAVPCPPQDALAPESPITRAALPIQTDAGRIKVDSAKLENLVDLVGEMIIAQSMVMQSGELAALRSETLSRDLARLGRISKELQHTAMSLRMLPIRGTFQKMNRLVRDLAAKAGKTVRLVTQGEDTELDRSLVEEINDPLIHMIRNSMDHGIENAELRQSRGKPPQGTIWLNAFHQGGNIVVEIRDDGNGLDRERILAKAVENKIIPSGDRLTENEVFNLIMAPGFSTADQVTELSGRGVGMDVVRRNVENLRGKIEIQSAAGQGSTFRVHLPLTMAIIDGLIVGAGEQRYIVPTLSICESFRPRPGSIKTVQGRGEMIEVRGKFRPLLRLCALFGTKSATMDPSEAMAVLIESGSHSRCLLVDQLLGKQEVVIKSLGECFQNNGYVAGAAIMGDGRVALILDPHALVHQQGVPLEAAA